MILAISSHSRVLIKQAVVHQYHICNHRLSGLIFLSHYLYLYIQIFWLLLVSYFQLSLKVENRISTFRSSNLPIFKKSRGLPVVQWMRICLPMQGRQVLIPGLRGFYILSEQLSRSTTTTGVHAGLTIEAWASEPVHHNKREPLLATTRESCSTHSNEDPALKPKEKWKPHYPTFKLETIFLI